MAFSFSRGCLAAGGLAVVIALAIAGCSMTGASKEAAATGPATAPAKPLNPNSVEAMGGAELWAQTCSHCHNLRDPSSYSAAQWDVAVFDMRVRAGLTGEQQRKILEFLKSAN